MICADLIYEVRVENQCGKSGQVRYNEIEGSEHFSMLTPRSKDSHKCNVEDDGCQGISVTVWLEGDRNPPQQNQQQQQQSQPQRMPQSVGSAAPPLPQCKQDVTDYIFGIVWREANGVCPGREQYEAHLACVTDSRWNKMQKDKAAALYHCNPYAQEEAKIKATEALQNAIVSMGPAPRKEAPAQPQKMQAGEWPGCPAPEHRSAQMNRVLDEMHNAGATGAFGSGGPGQKAQALAYLRAHGVTCDPWKPYPEGGYR
jgi:hypothetical protein